MSAAQAVRCRGPSGALPCADRTGEPLAPKAGDERVAASVGAPHWAAGNLECTPDDQPWSEALGRAAARMRCIPGRPGTRPLRAAARRIAGAALGAPRCMGRIGPSATRREPPRRRLPRRSRWEQKWSDYGGPPRADLWTQPRNRWRTARDGGHRTPGRGTGSWANQPRRAVSDAPAAATPDLSTAGPPRRPPIRRSPVHRAERPVHRSIAARSRTGIPRFHGMMTVMMRCKDRSLTPPEIHGPARRAGTRPGDNPT